MTITEEMQDTSTLPVAIDVHLIRRLRREGKKEEADDLLKAYHENLAESWKRTKHEIQKHRMRIRYHALNRPSADSEIVLLYI